MSHDGDLERFRALAHQARGMQSQMRARTDGELREARLLLGARLADGAATVSVASEASAIVGEAIRRAAGYVCPDSFIVAGAALHQGFAAESADDGRNALIGMFAAYLSVIQGDQAHFITVDPRAARHGFHQTRGIFEALGVQAGLVPEITAAVAEHQRAFETDVVFGSYLQMACEYLGNHLAGDPAELVGCKQQAAVIDQVDAVLVDHADDPLMIRAARRPDPDRLHRIAESASALRRGIHYDIDPATGRVTWTAAGLAEASRLLRADLQGLRSAVIRRQAEDALRAKDWYRRGVDFSLEGSRLTINLGQDGRMSGNPGLRSGVIQAIEMKEGLSPSDVVGALARITVRDFFLMYDRLCGISGEAAHASSELARLYQLSSIAVPSDSPARIDHPDLLFGTASARRDALLGDVVQRQRAGQPVLVGATSAADARLMEQALVTRGVDCSMAGGQGEAAEEVFAKAGRAGSVTVVAPASPHGFDVAIDNERTTAGNFPKTPTGLAVLIAGRSRSWRADHWLRGLAARRGYPGESRIYMSEDDALVRGLQSSLISAIPPEIRQRADGAPAGAAITRLIDGIQRSAEAADFESLLTRLDFEAVESGQRREVYSIRDEVLLSSDLRAYVGSVIDEVVGIYLRRYGNADRLHSELADLYKTSLTSADLATGDRGSARSLPAGLEDRIKADAHLAYARHEESLGPGVLRRLERQIILRTLDSNWQQHLTVLESMRMTCGADGNLRGRLSEYRSEAESAFRAMLERAKIHIVGYLFHSEVTS